MATTEETLYQDSPLENEAETEVAANSNDEELIAQEPVAAEDPTAQLAALTEKLSQAEDSYVRLQADFANFRRRKDKEAQETSALVAQNIAKDLLPIIDNFERALAAEHNDAAMHEGISMVYKQLMEILTKNGLEAIEAVGKPFDPNYHQAIMRVEDSSKESDTVAEELQRGYIMKGRVIRPSMVKVYA